MFFFFGFVFLLAIGSYVYLLTKASQPSRISSHITPTATISKGHQAVMQNPKEFYDENISFFYPDTLVINASKDKNIIWNSLVSGTIVTQKAMELIRQPIPFEPPTNIYNTKYFTIDDIQDREINSISILEYTINCGPHCSYRIDQFKMGATNYQLSFLTAGSGLSSRAEQILATLKPITPTPTISQSQKACTMEAKTCPDGSSVGRSGPNCEFAACPQ